MSNDNEKMVFNAKVIDSFRITVPEHVRDYKNIEEGDLLIVEITKVIKQVK